MWENKSVAGADHDPFWTWRSLFYTLLSETLPLNVRIILSGIFYDCFCFYVVCVCNHYCRMNQNHCSMIDLTIHISCVCDDFSSYLVSFSLVMSLKMMSLGLGHRFHFSVVKWWNTLFHFAMVKLWNFIFHFALVKWWNAIFHFGMVKYCNVFFHFSVVKWFFKPIGVGFKVGRRIEIFSHSKFWICFIVSNSFF